MIAAYCNNHSENINTLSGYNVKHLVLNLVVRMLTTKF